MLRLLGTPRVEVGDRPAERLPDKIYCLIALVILRFDGMASRGVLAELLWEERGTDAARANLRNVLSQLKAWQERNGVVLLQFDPSRVWRSPQCEPADLDVFLAAAPPETEAQLLALDEAFGGDLLAGRTIEFGAELSFWVQSQAALLRERFLSYALPAASVGTERSEQLLRRLSLEHPLDERIERALLTNLARAPSRSAAREEYRGFTDRLRQEAGTAPEFETRMVAASVGAASEPTPESAPTPFSQRRSAGLPRLLILPPGEALGGKIGAERVAASLIDDVTFGLSRMRTFAVIAPHTARALSRAGGNPAQLPEADYAVYTRLLPGSGSDYRFGFSLSRADTGEVLLGDQLRFSLSDLPQRHGDLSQLVIAHIAGEVERTERSAYRLSGSPTAYVYFLLGQERLRSIDLPDIRVARRAFRHALQLDRNFAPAMSMIARTLSFEWFLLNRGDPELLAESKRMAREAVERDPLDPAGYRELGNAALYSHDLDASLHFLEEARARAPHHADVLLDAADSLVHNSRFHEAKRLITEAMSLNPIAPDDYKWVAATIQFFLHDYRGAMELALGMRNPEPLGRVIAASAHLLGEKDVARHWRDRMLERHPDFRVADWGRIVPMRNPLDTKFFADAMRSAGFP